MADINSMDTNVDIISAEEAAKIVINIQLNDINKKIQNAANNNMSSVSLVYECENPIRIEVLPILQDKGYEVDGPEYDDDDNQYHMLIMW